MSDQKEKTREKKSLARRVFSMEALLLVIGIYSLCYGIFRRLEINIFWGVIIIIGVFILSKVRKKDWKKHWEEMEAEQSRRAKIRENSQKKPINPDSESQINDGK